MAQTRRRRQTKHRGNAAGEIVARGRTGGKAGTTARSAAGSGADSSRARREERLDRPPTWKGASLRALAAAVVVLIAGLALLHASTAQVLEGFPLVLAIYIPASYYTDLWLHKRRMRRKAQEAAGGR